MKDDTQEKDGSIVEGVVDDLIPGMGKVVSGLRRRSPELNRKIEENEAEIKRRLEEGYSPEPKIQYSVRVRTLAPDRDETKIKPEKQKKTVIEPVVDVFDEGSSFHVIVEMPGVDENLIHVNLQGTTIRVSATGKGRAYQKEILLPCQTRLEKRRFQNGILELTMEKTG
jgi:HSP20 family molecular chaperone IbpA